jgi:hypothetical protein
MNTYETLSEERRRIAIREFYNEFSPPRYVLSLVARLLSSVPAKYTNGLDSVVLTNQSGAPRRERLGKVTSRKRRLSQDGVFGRYHRSHNGRPAWIELYVDNLVSAVSHGPLIPLVRTACFGKVLFHEIGHHVHATVRPEFRAKEDVADDWGTKLLRHYVHTQYSYIPKWVLRLFGRVLKLIAAEL